jgi:hypothetical protein
MYLTSKEFSRNSKYNPNNFSNKRRVFPLQRTFLIEKMDWDSSDNESEFEGFTAEDIEGTEIPDAGSDISVSPVSTLPTSDNEIYANRMSEILMTGSGQLLLWKTTNKRKIFLINSFLVS